MSSFARDTAVERIDAGSYRAQIAPGWDIGGKTNGGYLLALVARAMTQELGRSDPASITAHYLRPAVSGPVTIQVQPVKQGKLFAVGSATLLAGERPLLQVLGSFGELQQNAADVERIGGVAPELPPPESCHRHDTAHGAPPMCDQLDMRLHPEDAGFIRGQASGEMRMRGWFGFADAKPVDTLGLLLALDSFPPTAFNGHLPIAWTPTVELTVHVRARPQPGWLRACFSTRFVSGGFLEEDGEIWDSSGRLVAQSRQLALLPREG